MSWHPSQDPRCTTLPSDRDVEWMLEGRPLAVDGVPVRRVLPSDAHRMVGPFVFFDHIGPADVPIGHGLDVRPHPHIHLATVTYLFEGEILHRDSLGSCQPIRPGAINWMTAGRGIVHSERTPVEFRRHGGRLHGIQLWVALPAGAQDVPPGFQHHPASTLPTLELPGAHVRILAGTLFGQPTPVQTLSPLGYAHVQLQPGATLQVPTDHPERAAYVVQGRVHCGAESAGPGTLMVFRVGSAPVLRAEGEAQLAILAGDPLDGPRYVWWNFVSNSRERIEQAKADWREGRFPKVPGDEVEFIPLPDS